MHRFCSLPLLSRRLCKTKNYRLVGRSKPRPYSAYFQHNTPQKAPPNGRVAPWCDRVGVWEPIGFSSLVPRASYLSYLLPLTSYLLPLTSSPRYRQDASLDHCRVVDTAVVAVPEVQRLWVTPGMSRSSPRHTPLSATKMQAWRACGTRLTPPCRLRLGGDRRHHNTRQ